MPELRATVTDRLKELVDELVEAGMFGTRQEAVRAAIVYFLKDLGWTGREKPGS